MHWTYSCPHCESLLNPEEHVVLRAEREGHRFLAGFHSELGNYEVDLPPGETMPKGTRWDFSCPVCDESLVSELSDDLCALDVHTSGETHRVYFSRIAGEEATCTISAEGLLNDYGIHTDRYLEHMVHNIYKR